MAIVESEIAQLTARANVGRAGTMRAGCAPGADELKADNTGEIIWEREVYPNDGQPSDNANTWTNERT